ncbi:MAG: ROK family protein [Bacteroidota bacterium]
MQTGNFQLVREINRRLLFGLIRERGEISRAELASATELSKATVSAVVDELIGHGLVAEGAAAVGAVGRRPILLRLNREGPCLGALHITPETIVGGIADLQGAILCKQRREMRYTGGGSHLKAAIEMMAAVEDMAARAGRDLLGVGVSLPGIINLAGDVVLIAPTLGWRDVSLRRMLETGGRTPVFLGDDAKMAALAESTAGAGRGAETLLYLELGQTVGAGLVRRGRLAGAAHAGHMTILPDGPPCWCGGRGCLDTLVSEGALAGRAAALLADGRRFAKDAPPRLTGEWLCRQAGGGDALAREILAAAADWLSIGLGSLINLYRPELVLLGGWITEAGGDLLAAVGENAKRRALAALAGPVEIARASLRADAVLTGAAALALAGALGSQAILELG